MAFRQSRTLIVKGLGAALAVAIVAGPALAASGQPGPCVLPRAVIVAKRIQRLPVAVITAKAPTRMAQGGGTVSAAAPRWPL